MGGHVQHDRHEREHGSLSPRGTPDGIDTTTPVSVLTEVEFLDRESAELFRLEMQRLARRFGTEVRSLHLERRLD
jgi:hypothetical protein